MKKKILLQLCTVYFAVMFSACDSMIAYIDIESADLPPMLAVNSTIDSNGDFSISFSEARSIGSYRNWQPEYETIIRKGKITLYDETGKDTLIQIENEEFDMSLRPDMEISGYWEVYHDLQFEAGHTYRLTLDIEGYPVATATTVMPEAPIIEQASVNSNQTVYFDKAYRIETFNPNTFMVFSIDCHPLTLRMTDNSPQRDYYTAKLLVNGEIAFNGLGVAIGDKAVIQDNPDIEASQMLMDNEANAFIFNEMMFSDMSFENKTGTINMIITTDLVRHYSKYPELPCDKDQRVPVTVSLCIAHITDMAYAHYRSATLQKAGMGFFSEPVQIVSNIENGYGCFSAANSAQITIAEYEICSEYVDY